jgi:acyl carrier protein phosphodiesterase
LNYLAHLYLSGDDPILRIGNLSGDFVKGINSSMLDPTIQRGIALHHSIDAFTDRNDTIQRSKQRIVTTHRFAGILVDVFYDHFLAANWDAHCDSALEDYVTAVYIDLQTYRALLPPALREIMPRMITENWLLSYRTEEGVTQALSRIERRLGGRFDLTSGIDDLKNSRAELEEDFRRFFPDLVAHARTQIAEMGEAPGDPRGKG